MLGVANTEYLITIEVRFGKNTNRTSNSTPDFGECTKFGILNKFENF